MTERLESYLGWFPAGVNASQESHIMRGSCARVSLCQVTLGPFVRRERRTVDRMLQEVWRSLTGEIDAWGSAWSVLTRATLDGHARSSSSSASIPHMLKQMLALTESFLPGEDRWSLTSRFMAQWLLLSLGSMHVRYVTGRLNREEQHAAMCLAAWMMEKVYTKFLAPIEVDVPDDMGVSAGETTLLLRNFQTAVTPWEINIVNVRMSWMEMMLAEHQTVSGVDGEYPYTDAEIGRIAFDLHRPLRALCFSIPPTDGAQDEDDGQMQFYHTVVSQRVMHNCWLLVDEGCKVGDRVELSEAVGAGVVVERRTRQVVVARTVRDIPLYLRWEDTVSAAWTVLGVLLWLEDFGVKDGASVDVMEHVADQVSDMLISTLWRRQERHDPTVSVRRYPVPDGRACVPAELEVSGARGLVRIVMDLSG
jgi:hypothetical protein